MKRARDGNIITRIRRHTNRIQWIPPSKLRNYMLNDTLVDWLEEHYSQKMTHNTTHNITPVMAHNMTHNAHFLNNLNCMNSSVSNPFTNFNKFIIEKGISFESSLIKYIETLSKQKDISIITVSDKITDETVKQTIDSMKKGIHIIHSAPIRNKKNNTHGIIDLLVRSDYLHKLVDECPLTEKEIRKSSFWYEKGKYVSRPYHYLVVDIKFSTLPLRADGKHLLNSGSYPAYKAQCLIYTEAIGIIQRYTPHHAFILGRRWKYTQNDTKYNNYTCLNKLGVINYKTVDEPYVEKTKSALEWVINNKKNGKKWSISPPSRVELYPNMCIDSGKWQNEKEKIADDIGEISSIWYCGWQNRNLAISKGIKTWKDPKCTSKNIGIKGTRSTIIDSILDINRQNIDKIRPDKIKGNLFDWKLEQNEIFVDFETLSDIFSSFDDLPNQKQTDMIFMIGVYYKSDCGNLEYKNFIAENTSSEEEYRIMNEFHLFVKHHHNPKLWYWYADDSFWKRATTKLIDTARANNEFDKVNNMTEWNKLNWADMCDIFKSEPIVIKGCFKFGLKSIAKSMKENGMIQTEMESVCNSGMNAMIGAHKFYSEQNKSDPNISNIMKDIEKYNKFDCNVLYDIMSYLRKNHV